MTPATYRCLACPSTWEAEPGPTECSDCGSLYVEWVDYDAWFQANLRRETMQKRYGKKKGGKRHPK